MQDVGNAVFLNILELVVKAENFSLTQPDQCGVVVYKAVRTEMHVPYGRQIAVSVFHDCHRVDLGIDFMISDFFLCAGRIETENGAFRQPVGGLIDPA